jgi:hypothetical protein
MFKSQLLSVLNADSQNRVGSPKEAVLHNVLDTAIYVASGLALEDRKLHLRVAEKE